MTRPASFRRGRVSGARALYVINHSDLRGIARPHVIGDRDHSLATVCEGRRWWFGGQWSQPASPGAQAALRVLLDRAHGDPLLRLQKVRQILPDDQLATFLQIRNGLRRLWTSGRAPLPGVKS